MLIPLGTERPLRRPTLITPAIIALNVLVFLPLVVMHRSSPEVFNRFVTELAVWGHDFRPWTLITSAFTHYGFLHILMNMLLLWVFGPPVEDKLGRIGFTAFYLAAAAASGGLHAALDPAPAVGASGAVSGVTGAFLVLFPRTHVRCLLFFFLITFVVIPAWWFIAIAIAWDIMSEGLGVPNGVANLAHLGGYAFGIAISMTLLATGRLSREPYDLFTTFRQARRRRELREASDERQRALQRQRAERDAADPARQARSDAIALARAAVAEHLVRREPQAAARAYRRLLSEHGERHAVLSRQRQYDLANTLFELGDHQSAATAYEGFISTFAHDRETPHMRLMLGLICARYLNDPLRASALIHHARDGGLDPDEDALARQLLQDLGLPADKGDA